MSNSPSGASIFGTLINRTVWLYTLVVFLLKLTRWIDWSWWSVFMPLVVMYVVAITMLVVGLSLKAASERSRRGSISADAYRAARASDVTPLGQRPQDGVQK